ncbi:uncharacterized protein [Palaemon carinicauda]|uniref:uncharacterized protein n=1 Tax=Palaemon carinicauda TaxID=392227 RepID=UPI0035B684DF
MGELFHRALTAALMSPCKDSNVFTHLPWVLLEIRTTLKDTLDVSAAEVVYGNSLAIHAEFFPSAISSENLQCLFHVVGKVTPCRQTYKLPAKQHIPTDLPSATHVFLRNEASKPPLTPHYTGFFLMIRRTPKAFCINICSKEEWGSNDCLKPAYLLPDNLPI